MNLNKLDAQFVRRFQWETQIEEVDANVTYSLKVRLKSTSRYGIYIDLPAVKKSAGYLQNDARLANPPKDCDAIIIDIDSNIVYLIEMKRTRAAAANSHIYEQLTAGERWWQHLSFCLDNTDHFTVRKVVVMVENRRSKRRGLDREMVHGYDFYRFSGNSLALEHIPYP